MATIKPRARYRREIFQANKPKRSVRAISFTMGAAMRKEKVIPRGTPARTKPINSGTAEQEQKGVTTPRKAAIILARPRERPVIRDIVRSGENQILIIPIKKTNPERSNSSLGA